MKNNQSSSLSSRKPRFIIDSLTKNSTLPKYNSLIDRNLKTHFYNENTKNHLKKTGLV